MHLMQDSPPNTPACSSRSQVKLLPVILTGPTPLCSEVYDTKGASLCITDRARRTVNTTFWSAGKRRYGRVPQLLACLLPSMHAAQGIARGGTMGCLGGIQQHSKCLR